MDVTVGYDVVVSSIVVSVSLVALIDDMIYFTV